MQKRPNSTVVGGTAATKAVYLVNAVAKWSHKKKKEKSGAFK